LKRYGADGRNNLKRKYENRMKGFYWIYLTQEKDKYVVVNTVLIFWALQNSGNYQLNGTVSSHKGLRYTELVIIIIFLLSQAFTT
jgi:hypothetical protein